MTGSLYKSPFYFFTREGDYVTVPGVNATSFGISYTIPNNFTAVSCTFWHGYSPFIEGGIESFNNTEASGYLISTTGNTYQVKPMFAILAIDNRMIQT